MESNVRRKIEELAQKDANVARLWKQHLELDDKSTKLDHKGFLTVEEQHQLQLLKAQKLKGVDELMRLVRAASPASAAAS